jgi:class 3 adenylate cyclase/tetratricopeptide (TPR) repeat protein
VSRLGSALPMDRLVAMVERRPLPQSSTGSVLTADVSGFSALANRLVRALGPKLGAEALSDCVDPVFEALISQLHAYGGSAIGFAGDGVTCWLDDGSAALVDAAPSSSRAAGCALAVQARMADLTGRVAHDGEPLHLALRIGIAAGSAKRFLVGDPGVRVMEMVAGSTVSRAAAAEALASPGDVVVSREIVDASAMRAEPLADGSLARIEALLADVPQSPWPDVGERPADDRLREWHHAELLSHVLAGSELVGDLRPAAVLFAHLGGIDYDAEPRAGERLDARVRAVQQSLARHGGTLIDVAIDHKGTYACCVVGAPVSHPDNTRRAAEAALDLQSAATEAGWPGGVPVGISEGRVWAGTYGTTARSGYSIRGDPVNLAARLMQRAVPGEILLSPAAAATLGATHDLRPLGEVALKGQSSLVDVSALSGRRRAAARSSAHRSAIRLIGREAELQLVTSSLDEVEGARRCVVVRGDAGVGKSRLLEAAVDEAWSVGMRVLASTASTVEQGTPYAVWRPVFEDLLGTDPKHMLAQLSDDEREHAPLLGVVLADPPPETLATRSMTPEVRQENTLGLLLRLLELHRGPNALLLVIDDAQWLDSASWTLLQRVARTAPRTLVLVGTRSEGTAEEQLEALLRLPEAQSIELAPLAADDSLVLVREALRADELPDAVARFVLERAGGHPFFSLELAYALRDAGQIEVVGGHCRIVSGADLARLEFPQTVEGVIANRVDRLGPEAQTALKVGSVLGQAFSADVLRELDVRGLGDRVSDRLAELEALDLLARDNGGYGFRHVLIRDVVYGRLLSGQRQGLHRKAAEHFECARAGVLPHGVLAHHWQEADVPDKAVDHLEIAGEDALRDGAFGECADFFARAMAFAEAQPALAPQERRAGWKWHAAQANYRLGKLAESRALAEAAVAAYDRPIPHGPRLGAAAAGQVVRQLLHRLLPRLFLDRAPASDRERILRAARACLNLAEVYYLASLKAQSAYAAVRALNLAERAGPSLELVETYGAICIIAGVIGKQGPAERYARLAFQAADRLGQPYATAIISHQVTLYRSGTGPYEQLIHDAERAIELFRRLGDKGRLRDCLGIAGIAVFMFGRPLLAERMLRELVETFEGGERSLAAVWTNTWLGAVELGRGNDEEALRLLRQTLSLQESNRLDMTTIVIHGLLARTLRRLGRDEEARAEAENARALIAESKGRPTGHVVVEGYVAVAEIALACWDEAEAEAEREHWRRRAREACRYLRKYCEVFPIGEPARRLYEGERAWRLGRRRRAVRALRRSLEAAERLDMLRELENAHRALAARLPDEREQHLEAAQRAHERMTAATAPAAPAEDRIEAEKAWTPA